MGPTMQSQRRPGEISAVELVRRDHPEDPALTASDSCRVQPHRRRSQPGRHHQLTSPRSTPFKERALQAAQRPLPALLHTCPGRVQGPDPHLGSNLALHFSDVSLGKSISWNRCLHL